MTRVFISYRRADSRHVTNSIYQSLRAHYGRENVFLDAVAIQPGMHWKQTLIDAVEACDVLLVIIGPEWVTAETENGQRLAEPNDPVRIEVETGLTRPSIRVIPVLVKEAHMPNRLQLPHTLQELTFRQAVDVRDMPEFERDVEWLIKKIDEGSIGDGKKLREELAAETQIAGMKRPEPQSTEKKGGMLPMIAAIAAITLVIVVAGLLVLSNGNNNADATSTAEAVALAKGTADARATIAAFSPTPSDTPTEAPSDTPTDTDVPPTDTPTDVEASDTPVDSVAVAVVASETPEPRATETNTAIPPTDTDVPSSDTPVPPTDTDVPPSDTPIPPTDTEEPPTETNTAVPPTDTEVPPTETNTTVPPTDTDVPPTDTDTPIPPTDTEVPPTETPTETFTPTETPIPVVELPYAVDFEDAGELEGWAYDPGEWFLTDLGGNTVIERTGGTDALLIVAGNEVPAWREPAPGDLVINFRFYLDRESSGVRVVFNHTERGYHVLEFLSGTVTLKRNDTPPNIFNRDSEQLIRTQTGQSIMLDTWHEVTIWANTRVVTVYIDDNRVLLEDDFFIETLRELVPGDIILQTISPPWPTYIDDLLIRRAVPGSSHFPVNRLPNSWITNSPRNVRVIEQGNGDFALSLQNDANAGFMIEPISNMDIYCRVQNDQGGFALRLIGGPETSFDLRFALGHLEISQTDGVDVIEYTGSRNFYNYGLEHDLFISIRGDEFLIRRDGTARNFDLTLQHPVTVNNVVFETQNGDRLQVDDCMVVPVPEN